MSDDITDVLAVCALNDAFRTTLLPEHGGLVVTCGVDALGTHFIAEALTAVRTFSAFTPQNDPFGEHDFGNFELRGERLFWKIDYYGPTMTYGSEDPSDVSKTLRVMTVMLAEEY